jgi:hypothetical protein
MRRGLTGDADWWEDSRSSPNAQTIKTVTAMVPIPRHRNALSGNGNWCIWHCQRANPGQKTEAGRRRAIQRHYWLSNQILLRIFELRSSQRSSMPRYLWQYGGVILLFTSIGLFGNRSFDDPMLLGFSFFEFGICVPPVELNLSSEADAVLFVCLVVSAAVLMKMAVFIRVIGWQFRKHMGLNFS